MRLGKHQLQLLAILGSPTCALIAPAAMAKSLIARGLLRERNPGGAVCITSAGLRQLADEMDAGRVEDALEAMRKDVEAVRARKPIDR